MGIVRLGVSGLEKPQMGKWALILFALSFLLARTPVQAQETNCARGDFEAVVDDAASALRDLNNANRPVFQEKLRELKEKNGWNHDQFMVEAAPFVRDDTIAVYDTKSQDLLAAIATLGQEGAEASTPDCAVLSELKARMTVLVETQTEKWKYMFSKLETALKK